MKTPKPKRTQYTCQCSAYRFPHRFGGGRCNGQNLVDDYWESHWGSGECKNCNCLTEMDGILSCDVYVGGDKPKECPIVQEFIYYNEIKLPKGKK